ncbi:LysE family translocator [Pararhodobacter sp. SW119]|uniref:LysE family translocator n=1 Tax=Pararhodobacter sp. SW119 TaxID=2780075 RepID=UPI001ADF0789|nr:LysE family translocator [Pararhodobacter sp. SW119]
MTVTLWQLTLYAGAIFLLFMTPGPVWVALTARALTGGFASAAPLAVGVAIGDIVWPLAAIFGLAWIISVYAGFMEVLRWVAVGMFLVMGLQLIRHAWRRISTDSQLTRPGHWSGFLAGVAAILANPKAILFYMGMLPGFFDLSRITLPDIAAILAISVLIPMAGNLILAGMIGRVRALLRSPAALARTNRVAGVLMIGVAAAIALA